MLENAAPGTAVGITAFADDADGTDTVSYSLDDDAGGRFAIDANTGVVTVAGGIDREAAASYDITVRATSSDTSTTTRTFTIAIGDVDEFDVGAVSDTDVGGQHGGRERGHRDGGRRHGLASDADATDNTITYSLDDDAGGRFAIDANTGVVTVAGGLDYETAHQPQHHGPGHQQRRSFADQSVHDQCDRRRRIGRLGAVSDTRRRGRLVLENAANGIGRGYHGLRRRRGRHRHGHLHLDDDAGGGSPSTPTRAW